MLQPARVSTGCTSRSKLTGKMRVPSRTVIVLRTSRPSTLAVTEPCPSPTGVTMPSGLTCRMAGVSALKVALLVTSRAAAMTTSRCRAARPRSSAFAGMICNSAAGKTPTMPMPASNARQYVNRIAIPSLIRGRRGATKAGTSAGVRLDHNASQPGKPAFASPLGRARGRIKEWNRVTSADLGGCHDDIRRVAVNGDRANPGCRAGRRWHCAHLHRSHRAKGAGADSGSR